MSKLLFVSLVATCAVYASGVRVLFDPRNPEIGPFPTDFLTVPDASQQTGVRVNLPLPDCQALASDCGEIRLINQLDGFNPNPRLTVKFSGPVDTATLSKGLFYVWLDPVLAGRAMLGPVGKLTKVNQIVWDAATNTAYAKPDEPLEPSRRYMIVVTDAVKDRQGDPVETDLGLVWCFDRTIGGDYCRRFAASLPQAAGSVAPARVVGASLYTALSASAWFEQAVPVIAQTPPAFTLTPATGASATSIDAATIASITVHKQTALTGTSLFSDTTLPVTPGLVAQFGVGSVVFGSIQSPRFIGQTFSIPNVPTLASPAAAGTEQIFFHVWLPKSAAPSRGYPVLLAGHGLGDDRFGLPTVIAAANAAGYAVVAMNAVGHGGGQQTTVRLTRTDGSVIEFPAPGRNFDLDGNGKLDPFEGCVVAIPGNPVGLRDCFRQTVVDYLQLIRAIKAGLDLNGDGRADLDGSAVNYIGQSLGGGYGSLLTEVSPDINAAVLNVPPGNQSDARLSVSLHALAVGFFALRQPSLLNNGADFIDDIPLRNEAVKVRSTPGAAAIQDFIERVDWMDGVASNVALAPLMKSAPLPGQAAKRVLFQMALGDKTVANPSTSSLIRAADLANMVSLYRADIAKTIDPTLPDNPHTFLIPFGTPAQAVIGFAGLQQAFTFIASGANVIPDANATVRALIGKDLFEQPPAALPEK